MPDLNVLILEDVEADAELVLHELERSGYTVTAVRVETETDYLAQLERGPDIILADYSLPQFDGRRALQLLMERQLDIPFIVITSTISDEVAVDCIKRGAADYLFKDRLARLGSAIGRAFAERDLRVEKRSAEAALRESESRFRDAVEAAPDGLLSVDPDGKIILANTQIKKMFGYSREELLGQPVEILIPMRLRSGHKEHRAGYAADPHVRSMGQRLELAALRKDGREFPVEISLGPLAAGSGLQVLATVRDVTERKRIDRALREAEAGYRSLFENAVEGIYRSAPGGGFLSVNPALARMLGYDSPELLKNEITNIGKQLYVDAERRVELARVLEEEGVVRAFEAQMRCRDGLRIWVSIGARAVLDSEGNVASYEGMIEDITERVELRDQVLRSQKMEAIGRLAGGIAHDFNNMLTVILGHTGIMLQAEAGSDENHQQHLDSIKRAAERSAGLTRQLLAFGRKQIMQPAVLNLNTVVSELDKMLRRIIGEDIRLQTSLDAALRNVKVDPSRIEQVMMNLVVNSRDAMPEGGRLTIETLNVELGRNYARSHHDVERGFYVMLAVSDTGIGMDSATQSRIFEPFLRRKARKKVRDWDFPRFMESSSKAADISGSTASPATVRPSRSTSPESTSLPTFFASRWRQRLQPPERRRSCSSKMRRTCVS